ncbi:MAG: hypothetical protein HZA90_20850 [Verrucomicrobia bacterium]|nr:hypothetical protein [Verrucomicrobiota bacterium]
MPTKNEFNTSVSGGQPMVFNTAGNLTFHAAGRSRAKVEHPQGSIGADLMRRNYVRYLVERYNRFREADASFGRTKTRFSYAFIFKKIEAEFKAPTYFIPVGRFDELVDYLQARIDQTILGKKNRAHGHRNYETFDEYQAAQSQAVG